MLYFTKVEIKYARSSSVQTQAKLKAAIKDLQVNSTPTISEFATWCLTNYSEIAFHSVRALADIANVNANTVVRFSKELGFKGYEDLRQNVQSTLRATALKAIKTDHLCAHLRQCHARKRHCNKCLPLDPPHSL